MTREIVASQGRACRQAWVAGRAARQPMTQPLTRWRQPISGTRHQRPSSGWSLIRRQGSLKHRRCKPPEPNLTSCLGRRHLPLWRAMSALTGRSGAGEMRRWQRQTMTAVVGARPQVLLIHHGLRWSASNIQYCYHTGASGGITSSRCDLLGSMSKRVLYLILKSGCRKLRSNVS